MSDRTVRAVNRVTNYDDPKSFGSKLRARRSAPLLKLIIEAHSIYGHVKVLDIGGRKSYWSILPKGFLERHRVTVTLLNLPGEQLGPDDETFRHVVGNATSMPQYENGAFHIAHSNSVIEHVGRWPVVRQFANESRRVASGLFVQTPYFWFPIEPHYMMPFFHWCPRPIQELMVRKLPLGYLGRKEPDIESAISCIEDAPRLLDLRAFRLLFPECEIIKERICFLTKSLIAVRSVSKRIP